MALTMSMNRNQCAWIQALKDTEDRHARAKAELEEEGRRVIRVGFFASSV